MAKIVTEDFEMCVGSQVLRNFITFILRKDPEKRPNAEAIINHPFIQKFKELETNEELFMKPIKFRKYNS